MRSRFFALLMAVSFAACSQDSPTAPSPPAAASTFTLSGQVTDSASGSAIGGATLTIADGPGAGRSTTTDSAGNYTFVALPRAGFTLNATATGYTPTSKGVTLTSDQTVPITLSRIPLQGQWTGTTGQGRSIRFTVDAANSLTLLTAEYAIPSCGITGSVTVTFTTPSRIPASGALNVSSTEFSLTGTFSSPTTASGTMTFRPTPIPGIGCSASVVATWSATKS